MSAVRGVGNISTELALAKLLRRAHVHGWRRHTGGIFGRPDFVFKPEKVAVFVDGCFWHGCREIIKYPLANRTFWVKKIRSNRIRDRKVTARLKAEGWKVVRIWEHELKRDKWRAIARISNAVSLRS